jgi:hypothetical protein
MAITYTTLATENLGNNQVRKLRAYDAAGGVIFNIIVENTIIIPYGTNIVATVVDTEIFVPGATVALLAGISFSITDTVILEKGQKRYVREYSPSTGGKIVELIRTQDYEEAPGGPTKVILVGDSLTFVAAAATTSGRTSITGAVNYVLTGSFQDVLVAPASSALQVSFTALANGSVDVHLVLSILGTVAAGDVEVRLLLDGTTEVAWNRNTLAIGEDRNVSMSTTVTGLSAGAHTLKVQIDVLTALMAVTPYSGTHKGKLEYRLHH